MAQVSATKPGAAAGGTAGGGTPKAAPAPATSDASEARRSGKQIAWKSVWPIPALGASMVLLGAGVILGILRAPKADPAAPMVTARELLEAGEFEKSIEVLNTKLVPPLQTGVLGEKHRAEFFLLRAEALFKGQLRLGTHRPENYRAILADFASAQKAGAVLTDEHLASYAESAMALGETDRAVELARSLGEKQPERRTMLYRRIIERNLASTDVRAKQTFELLQELFEMPGLPVDDLAWVVARQTELRLAMNFEEESITKLLRTLPRLDGMTPEHRGELLYLLGKAYFQTGQTAEAAAKLELADQQLPPSDHLRSDAQVLLARILQSVGRQEEARERFALVRSEFPDAASQKRALFGLAETCGTLGDDDLALEHYTNLIELLRTLPARRDVTLIAVAQSLMERQADRFVREDFAHALQYAQRAADAYRAAAAQRAVSGAKAETASSTGETSGAGHGSTASAAAAHGPARHEENPAEPVLAPGQTLPSGALLALGASHKRMGELVLSEAMHTAAGTVTIDQVSPVTASEAKRHYLEAGQNFREHARSVLTTDTGAYAQSLWTSADCFDQAGEREAAKEAFGAYMDGAADNDPRKAEARFRLAQIFQAERDYTAAAALYKQIIDSRSVAELGAPGSGIIADRAIVPLARCLLADKSPDNDARAEELLRSVVSGSTFPPEALEYRQAVTELGELLAGTGRYAEAISRLDEVVRRYPDDPRANAVKYKLAEACRSSAAEMALELRQAMPQGRRDEMEKERSARLVRAAQLYQQVLDSIGRKDAALVTDLDRLQRRNSLFYTADCAFELGDDAAAIRAYDAAAQQFASDPASLVARVQIVSCYLRQRKWAEALAANERAKRQLAGVPADAFDNPDMPMQRRHWERWLEADAELQQRMRATASP